MIQQPPTNSTYLLNLQLRFSTEWNPNRTYRAVRFGEPWNGWATPVVERDVLIRLLADISEGNDGYDGQPWYRVRLLDDRVARVESNEGHAWRHYATLTPGVNGTYWLRDLGFTLTDCSVDPLTVVWSAGHNDAGYSPDPESVSIFATQEAARLTIADDIDRLADFLADQEQDSATIDYATAEEFDNDTDRLSFGASADAENVKGNADGDYSGEFSISIDDGRPLPTVYWVQQTTLADAFGPDIDSDEYRAVVEDLNL